MFQQPPCPVAMRRLCNRVRFWSATICERGWNGGLSGSDTLLGAGSSLENWYVNECLACECFFRSWKSRQEFSQLSVCKTGPSFEESASEESWWGESSESSQSSWLVPCCVFLVNFYPKFCTFRPFLAKWDSSLRVRLVLSASSVALLV